MWIKRTLILLPALLLLASGCGNDPYPPEAGLVVLHSVIGEDPKGLDPVAASDVLSNSIACQIYDSLFQFHYLKRPYEIEPNLAAAMPKCSGDGLTMTIALKKGVHFQDDPCFTKTGGAGREAVASDFVYSMKRLADVATKTNGWWTVAGKIVGLDEFNSASIEAVRKKVPLDYSKFDVSGLQALDDHTIQIRLKQKYPQLKYILAMSFTAIVPHEAVEYYGNEFVNHPVGTGAFRLKEWKKQHLLTLERNPTYRDAFYPSDGAPGDREQGLLDDAGKKLPLTDEIRYTVIRESQPSWILFLQGYCDASGIPKDNFDRAVPSGQELSQDFKDRGIVLKKQVGANVFYWGFNMRNEVVGKNKKLRQAVSCAYDRQRNIRVFQNGRAIPAEGPLPPGIFGYDPALKNRYAKLNLELARKLLAEAGYPGGKNPNGEQLIIAFDTLGDSVTEKQVNKALVRDIAKIGVKLEIVQNTWAQLQKKVREGRVQLYRMGWVQDFPDPQNFLQLLYGPNRSPGPNGTFYDDPEYNRLFEQMEMMENGPERLAIIRKMIAIVNEDCPWVLNIHNISYGLYHEWARNRKPNDLSGNFAKYLSIDKGLRTRRIAEWNRMPVAPLLVFLGVVVAAGLAAAVIGRHLPPRLATRKPRENG